VDHEFRVEPYNEAGVITGTLFTNTKNKDGQMVEPVVFDMISVGLGICDEDAQEITTLVPELRGPARDYEEDLPDPLRVVIDEEYKLRRRDALTKRALIDAVRVELGCAKRTAERWVKRAIDEEKIDV
jgi:hypothetical protein